MYSYQQLRAKGLPALYAFLVATRYNENEYNLLIARGLVVADQDGFLTIQQYPVAQRRNLRFGSDAISYRLSRNAGY